MTGGLVRTMARASTEQRDLTSHPWWPFRMYYHSNFIENGIEDSDTDPYDAPEERKPTRMGNANLVSSRTKNGLHAPVIDVDFPIAAIPSRTPGHYHLYLDVTMSWRQYRRMLKAMVKAGVVEKGYYKASKARKMTMCRWRYGTHFIGATSEERGRMELLQLREELAAHG